MKEHFKQKHPELRSREDVQKWKQKKKDDNTWRSPDRQTTRSSGQKWHPKSRAKQGGEYEESHARHRGDSREKPSASDFRNKRYDHPWRDRRSQTHDRRSWEDRDRRSWEDREYEARYRGPPEDRQRHRSHRAERWRSRSPSIPSTAGPSLSLRERSEADRNSGVSQASYKEPSSASANAKVGALADMLQAQANFLRNA